MDEQVREVHDQFLDKLESRIESAPAPPAFAQGAASAPTGKFDPSVVLHYLSVVLPTIMELIMKLQQPQQSQQPQPPQQPQQPTS